MTAPSDHDVFRAREHSVAPRRDICRSPEKMRLGCHPKTAPRHVSMNGHGVSYGDLTFDMSGGAKGARSGLWDVPLDGGG